MLTRLFIYAAAISMLLALDLGMPTPRVEAASGIWLYLSRQCGSADSSFSNRTVVVQLLANGTSRINSTDLPEKDLPTLMAQVMASRSERVMYVIADDTVAYGRVVNNIDRIKAAVQHLVVVLPPRDKEGINMGFWCISSADILPDDR